MYITINRSPRHRQITFEDILAGIDEQYLIPQKDTKDTFTWIQNNTFGGIILG